MDRRAFIAGLGVLLAAPITAGAEQAGKVWRIGFISVTHTNVVDVFFQQLRTGDGTFGIRVSHRPRGA